MKLTKQILVTLIEEAIEEPAVKVEVPKTVPIDTNSPDWLAGLSEGSKTAQRLVAKREVQTEKGIRKYIKAASGHRSASFQAGYKLGFELHMSKTLGEPIPDGQLPYANAKPSMPSTLFDKPRGGKNPLSTLEEKK